MFQKYASFQTADFVADTDFIAWVRRPTPQSNQFWLELQEVFPHQKATIQKAQQAVSLLIEESANTENARKDAEVVWAGIEESLAVDQPPVIDFRPFNWKRWVAAAAIIFIIGVGWWIGRTAISGTPDTYQALVEEAENLQPLEETVNTTTEPKLVSLPDGSTITLEKDSRISFAHSFEGKNREVYLMGAAFFDVTKNPDKPFLVYSNELVTKVLGTSFRVQAFEKDKNIVVSVKTGLVSVYPKKSPKSADPETAGLLLTPNQEVSFARAEERFNRTLIEKPTVLLTQEELQQYSFDNAPVSRIFAALEKAYGVDIVFDEEVMTNCHLTTSLAAETLFDKLSVICEAIGATYKVVDAQVVIDSRGCI